MALRAFVYPSTLTFPFPFSLLLRSFAAGRGWPTHFSLLVTMIVRILRRFPSLLLVATLAFAGCVTTARFSERGRLECPVPPVICQPGTFDQTILDTSSSPLIRTRHYLSIARVNGLNTEVDEFGVAFPNGGDGRTALATTRNNRATDRRDHLLNATFSTITSATVGTNVPVANGFGPWVAAWSRKGPCTLRRGRKGRQQPHHQHPLLAIMTCSPPPCATPRRHRATLFPPW
ncbi:MAG: hypothetical protein UZ07_CHB004002361 [Chlorobi bacterium OLB7]|nr:MAG: hypothetical protein UZ07_CHB004002361 [Chlorobi bacterium OLB7]